MKTMPTTLELMWAVTGLLLTIGGTLLQPSILLPNWAGKVDNVVLQQIDVTLQVGAVLLTGCLGGKNAGLLSQVAYIFLGLSGFGVFHQGGGLNYVKLPAFGYLLGFIPGAWVCGFLAFLRPPSLDRMTISCLGGLLTIHLVGIIYLTAITLPNLALLQRELLRYSVHALSGQAIVVCATVVVATVTRRMLFY